MTALLPAVGSIAEYFLQKGTPEFLALVIAAIIHAVVLISFFGLAPFAFIWLERKVSGRIQDRLGPTRVGGRFGWLQSLADGIKLVQKEDLCPDGADSMLFRSAPYLVCISSFAAFIVLPFSDGWVAVASDVGLFVMLAIMSLEVFGIIMAGYSSASKWSLFGGMREAAQMVSYEIPMGICAVIPIIIAGTLNLGEIGSMQRGWFVNWFLFHDPFTFLAFFVYFTVATASCKRAPFDLAEAESELVGGFHTEYSGMRWSFFFLGEYASMFAVSALAAILFLGGWNTGIGPIDALLADGRGSGWSYPANVIGMLIVIVKGSALVFFQIWLRWTVPRLRIDQVMVTCLKYLLPISCFLFLGATLWPFLLLSASGNTSIGSPVANRAGTPGSMSASQVADLPKWVNPIPTPIPFAPATNDAAGDEAAAPEGANGPAPPADPVEGDKRGEESVSVDSSNAASVVQSSVTRQSVARDEGGRQ